jgi:hypothetical protein
MIPSRDRSAVGTICDVGKCETPLITWQPRRLLEQLGHQTVGVGHATILADSNAASCQLPLAIWHIRRIWLRTIEGKDGELIRIALSDTVVIRCPGRFDQNQSIALFLHVLHYAK